MPTWLPCEKGVYSSLLFRLSQVGFLRSMIASKYSKTSHTVIKSTFIQMQNSMVLKNSCNITELASVHNIALFISRFLELSKDLLESSMKTAKCARCNFKYAAKLALKHLKWHEIFLEDVSKLNLFIGHSILSLKHVLRPTKIYFFNENIC